MKIGTTRVETFSDGVIAIIITIMALELKLPDLQEEASAQELKNNLFRQWPYFVAYAFSFVMIGIFWINHHHLFHLLDKTDERLLLQNLVFLFFISLIPIATATVGANAKLPEAVGFYGLIMLLATASLAAMRAYSINKALIHKDEDPDLTGKVQWASRRGKIKNYIGSGAYLLAIPMAFFSVYIAYFLFLVPPIIFFIPDGIDDEKLAEKIEEKNN